MNMERPLKEFPTWTYTPNGHFDSLDLERLISDNELVLDRDYHYIYFFSDQIKLDNQEFNFLYHVLASNTRKKKNNNKNSINDGYISASRLMKAIKAKTNASDKQKAYNKNALRIRNHIKKKVKDKRSKYSPAPDTVNWIPIDKEYYSNPSNLQLNDIKHQFNMLISVKKNKYSTKFIKASEYERK